MALKIFHTSDWHLGHELAGYTRENEHQAFLDWLTAELQAQAANVLLVTGDIYDVANPPISATRQLFRFLFQITRLMPHLQIIILGGNHDSGQRIDLPAELLGDGLVRFVGNLPRTDGQIDLDKLLIPLLDSDGQLAALLAALPFCRPGDLARQSLSELYRAVQEAALDRARGLPVVVTGHLHVSGGEISEFSERRLTIGGEEAEAVTLFHPQVSYVALGHLHRPQQIEGPTLIRYSGSPFPLSAAERNYHHSLVVVTVDQQGLSHSLLPIPRPVPFLQIPALPLDQAVQAIAYLDVADDLPMAERPFLEVFVKVSGPEPLLQTRIQEAVCRKSVRLTRLVREIDKGNTAVTLAPLSSAMEIQEQRPEDMFQAIYARDYGNLPPDDLMRAFSSLLLHSQSGE